MQLRPRVLASDLCVPLSTQLGTWRCADSTSATCDEPGCSGTVTDWLKVMLSKMEYL